MVLSRGLNYGSGSVLEQETKIVQEKLETFLLDKNLIFFVNLLDSREEWWSALDFLAAAVSHNGCTPQSTALLQWLHPLVYCSQ